MDDYGISLGTNSTQNWSQEPALENQEWWESSTPLFSYEHVNQKDSIPSSSSFENLFGSNTIQSDVNLLTGGKRVTAPQQGQHDGMDIKRICTESETRNANPEKLVLNSSTVLSLPNVTNNIKNDVSNRFEMAKGSTAQNHTNALKTENNIPLRQQLPPYEPMMSTSDSNNRNKSVNLNNKGTMLKKSGTKSRRTSKTAKLKIIRFKISFTSSDLGVNPLGIVIVEENRGFLKIAKATGFAKELGIAPNDVLISVLDKNVAAQACYADRVKLMRDALSSSQVTLTLEREIGRNLDQHYVEQNASRKIQQQGSLEVLEYEKKKVVEAERRCTAALTENNKLNAKMDHLRKRLVDLIQENSTLKKQQREAYRSVSNSASSAVVLPDKNNTLKAKLKTNKKQLEELQQKTENMEQVSKKKNIIRSKKLKRDINKSLLARFNTMLGECNNGGIQTTITVHFQRVAHEIFQLLFEHLNGQRKQTTTGITEIITSRRNFESIAKKSFTIRDKSNEMRMLSMENNIKIVFDNVDECLSIHCSALIVNKIRDLGHSIRF